MTGFMVKTPEELVMMLGTAGENVFYLRGILHRIAAILFMTTTFYVLLYRPKGLKKLTSVIPKTGDFKDLPAEYSYYLGTKDKPPKFIYINKFKHLAFISIAIILIVTGVILWTKIDGANLPLMSPQ